MKNKIMHNDFLSTAWSKDSILDVVLPKEINDHFYSTIKDLHKEANPYIAKDEIAYTAAYKLYKFIELYCKENSHDVEAIKICQAVEGASTGKNLPPILIRNGITEPNGSLIPPPINRGFEYGENAEDRMKEYYYTEWFAWIFAIIFNHDNIIHPSEHGGKNRFHAISPRPAGDEYLRDVGASTGGGEFKQHNDATVYNDFISKRHFVEKALELHTDIPTIVSVCKEIDRTFSEETLIQQVFSGKYICVDALTLTGVLNIETHTHIGTPMQLQKHLYSLGFTIDDIYSLSKMAVGHFAGPADGDISNYFGTIAPPIIVKEGKIIGTHLNAEKNRMTYVGSKKSEEALFDKFHHALSTMPLHKVLLSSGELLFIPNAVYGVQQNVTHGREELSLKEYSIDIGKGIPGRRHQSRQYTSSRYKSNKESFLSKFRNYFNQDVNKIKRS